MAGLMRSALMVVAAVAITFLASPIGAQCSPGTQKLIDDHRSAEARAELQALLKKNASDDAALHCMGMTFISEDKAGDAQEWFEKAIKANDNSSAHHLWLGNAIGHQAEHANKLKQPFMARRIKSEFERAVQLDPGSIDARHGLIQFYSQAPGVMGGSMDKAKEQAREIQKVNAMRGHIEMGALLERDKDVAGAERELEAAITASPDSAPGYNNLAALYRRQKRYADAVPVYERLLKARPDLINARLNIAYNLALSGQGLDRGEHEAKQWFAEPPKDVPAATLSSAHYILGLIYEKQAKKDSAREEYQAAVAANAKNEEAKKALANLK